MKLQQVRRGTGDLSRSAVLALLGRGPASRAEIARELQLSPAAVTQIVRRLLDLGMVAELAQAPSRGGRPGQLIGLVGSVGRALGVKVAVDHLAIVNVRLDGHMLTSSTVDFDATAPEVLTRLGEALKPHIAATAELPQLLGVGLAVPGIVASPDGGTVDADVLSWSDLPVGRYLRDVLRLPVVVENDVNALAVAEVLYGHGREVRDFLVATVGRGIGLGIVANGTVYRGGRGGAGEFGHVPVLADGPVCACGRRGCLEAVVGEQALTRAGRVAGVLGPRQGLGALARAAERSRPNARAVFAEAGQVLGRALAGIANVLDPDRILLLGEGTEHWAFWDDAFRTEFARHHVGRDEVDIVVDAWDDSAWAQGAAALVLAAPFDLDGFGGEQADQVVARLHSVADGLAG